MKNIAFVSTEYQQNVLFAICLQENLTIDILFLRKNIIIHTNVQEFVDKVVYYEDVTFSWKSVLNYYREYCKTVSHYIHRENNYRIFTWSIENPLVRYAINISRCKDVNLFEDGSGSYIKWGLYNKNLGFKTFLVSSFIFLFTNTVSGSYRPLKDLWISGWSLYKGCYPDLRIHKRLINHQYFQQVIKSSLKKEDNYFEIENKAKVFINSPYIEFGILSEIEYEIVLKDVVEMIVSSIDTRIDKVFWKIHPRTNFEKEKKRVQLIADKMDIKITLIPTNESIESFALRNQKKDISYYSLGSSSLYVIKALVGEKTSVSMVESDILSRKFRLQKELVDVYRSIGIRII